MTPCRKGYMSTFFKFSFLITPRIRLKKIQTNIHRSPYLRQTPSQAFSSYHEVVFTHFFTKPKSAGNLTPICRTAEQNSACWHFQGLSRLITWSASRNKYFNQPLYKDWLPENPSQAVWRTHVKKRSNDALPKRLHVDFFQVFFSNNSVNSPEKNSN